MAHTYIITSATSVGDICTINGTVDGNPVTIVTWKSAITALPNTAAVQNFIAPQMLSAAVMAGAVAAAIPPTVPAVTAAGTFSQ